jgi:hypothetical protein
MDKPAIAVELFPDEWERLAYLLAVASKHIPNRTDKESAGVWARLIRNYVQE